MNIISAIPPKNFSGWMSRIARRMMGSEFVAYLKMLDATRLLPCSRTPRTCSGASAMRSPLLEGSKEVWWWGDERQGRRRVYGDVARNALAVCNDGVVVDIVSD